jgi:hypothetical protein
MKLQGILGSIRLSAHRELESQQLTRRGWPSRTLQVTLRNRYWTVKGQSPYQLGCSAVLEVRTSAITTSVKAPGSIVSYSLSEAGSGSHPCRLVSGWTREFGAQPLMRPSSRAAIQRALADRARRRVRPRSTRNCSTTVRNTLRRKFSNWAVMIIHGNRKTWGIFQRP